MNNKTLTIAVVVLAIAVAGIFVMHFTCGRAACSKKTTAAEVSVQTGGISIAYINSDSLLIHYELYKKTKG